jgi:glycosyltransferase involved in cell wall biosynthesis
MRIAMVSEHASPLAVLGGQDAGGQNVHVAALATALARRGHRVEVFTRRDDPDLPRRVPLAGGVEVVHVDAGPARVLPKDDLLPHMQEMAENLARAWAWPRTPDVVHAHFWMSALASRDALRAGGGAPLAVTFHALGVVKRRHQGAADPSPPCRLATEAELLGEADAVVATCRDEVSELLALGADPRRLHVAPCGVDVRQFRPDGPVRLPWREGATRLLSLGRLVERKGVETVVEALALLPGAELVVAGGPAPRDVDGDPEVRRLRDRAEALGVADRLQVLGQVGRDEAAALMRGADAVVCVPWYEPFGIVPLEAMACGTPVLASAVGGMLDSVEHGVTGLHVPPRDPDALAAAVRELTGDPGRAGRMGLAGVTRVRQRYTWDRVAATTLRVYERLVAARPPDEVVDLRGAADLGGVDLGEVVRPPDAGPPHLGDQQDLVAAPAPAGARADRSTEEDR